MAFNVAATVTLCSYRNASLFWIMLWLVSGPADHGMILAGRSRLFRHVAWNDAQREWSFFGALLAALGCRATLALQHALITSGCRFESCRAHHAVPANRSFRDIAEKVRDIRNLVGCLGRDSVSLAELNALTG
jgi:hypothetical protein